ncbi:MAG: CCA tRNA nucleotidyltransferase [Methanoregulaceae archaeon]
MNRTPLEEQVLARIRPTPGEREQIHNLGDRLIAAVNASGIAQGMLVGSIARGTWIRGDLDLDVFLLFPPDTAREVLEKRGTALGREIAAGFGGTAQEKYAEHPYINASIEGVDVDLVPCYHIADAAHIQSAVDRTPFHTRFLLGRIDGFTDDVLLFKQFAKACGVYGSDHMTEGFSGYLCELLVIRYGGFRPLLTAAASWRPGTHIDIVNHAGKKFDDPLVVIDPVDPNRNVAASLSLSRMYEFVEVARGYLKDPHEGYFTYPEQHALNRGDVAQILSARGTRLIAVTFRTPPYIEDVVVPQLRKSTDAIRELAERNGFIINRTGCCMGKETSILLFEFLVSELPPVKRHMGPPLWNPENAEKFAKKYLACNVTGPYIDEGRYWVEVKRNCTRAIDLFHSPELMVTTSLGKHVRQSMIEGMDILEGEECWKEEFAECFGEFFSMSSPLVRIERRRGSGTTSQ